MVVPGGGVSEWDKRGGGNRGSGSEQSTAR
jgi:hypothetical protein